MAQQKNSKYKILIADDSEMNRAILIDMLGEEYEFLEAENGRQAVELLEQHSTELSLVLLDIVMPEMDGFGVLQVMNQKQWIDDVPVIMISAESGSSHVERAYKLGVTDFVGRPFDAMIVHRRVVNTIMLYAKQKKLIGLVTNQIYEKEQHSALMIDILSHIVEFRNGESGLHVLHVRTLTEMFLRHLIQKSDRYSISRADVVAISTASALHDIGKIVIPDNIINKPGRLTNEEFTIMKSHALTGAEMLANLPIHKNEPLIQVAYDICRWHHERWDGRGYPDGLKGDDIPISAQIVALADVYDALTSVRVYKPPFPHEKAVQMILNGECGVFNPLLLECLIEISADIPEHLGSTSTLQVNREDIQSIAEEMLRHEELSASGRTLQLLEHERMKYSFFAAMTQEIQFEFTVSPPMLTLNTWGAEKLGLAETVPDPMNHLDSPGMMNSEECRRLADALHATTPEHPVITCDTLVPYPDGPRWCRIISRAMWSTDEPPRYTGVIGKAVDIHESRMKLNSLEEQASHDAMTGLLNHKYAKQHILQRLEARQSSHYALAIVDLDHFKNANDTYGHLFGDRVLMFIADTLRANVRGGDIAARVGGDEFLLFVEYSASPELPIQRIYNCLSGKTYEQFPISLSMGVATTQVVGTDYETLFHAADSALYSVKRGGRGSCRFYTNETMEQTPSSISPIDSDQSQSGTAGKESTT